MAKLNNGQIVEYDLLISADDPFEPNREVFKFLGVGVVYKINDIEQTSKGVLGKFYKQRVLNEQSS